MRKEGNSLASSPRTFISPNVSVQNTKNSDIGLNLNMGLINNITSDVSSVKGNTKKHCKDIFFSKLMSPVNFIERSPSIKKELKVPKLNINKPKDLQVISKEI